LAGLRKLESVIEEEIRQMPILDDIMDHGIIGRERKKGMEIGRAEGLAEGEAIGERRILLNLIDHRFGGVPEWARVRLQALSSSELEKLSQRLLDAASLDDLFAQ